MKYKTPKLLIVAFIIALPLVAFSCSKDKTGDDKKNILPPGGPHPTILISQAQFLYEEKNGVKLPKPGPAIMTLKQKTPDGWSDTIIEDPQSNVFHKALLFNDGSKKCILTIGAMGASLKIWEVRQNNWHQTLLWNPVFGGKWDRLRDVETGDVTGDNKTDIVIATHDQGVVAVATKTKGKWAVTEIDREPGIFVHEIEIGDIDGDGNNEFFATPSKPNKAKGGPQPGRIIMYRWNGSGFEKKIVDDMPKTHAKEILAFDVDGSGISTLFSAVEAETKEEGGNTVRVEPVKIKQYVFDNGTVSGTVIATLNDYQCRFLSAGDVDGDGEIELVSATMKTGLWLLKRLSGTWTTSLIDSDSSGYEHAICIDDLDGNGIQEIYVAADDQREFRMYQWNGNNFSKTVLSEIPRNRITWNITTGKF